MSSYLRGYATVRPFGGNQIPVPIQNLVMRNYANSKGYTYILPMNEHKFENCYMQLFASIFAMETNGKLVMCSSSMLPTERSLRQSVIDKIIFKRIECHFVFESKIVSRKSQFLELEQTIQIRNLADQVDKESSDLIARLKHFNKN